MMNTSAAQPVVGVSNPPPLCTDTELLSAYRSAGMEQAFDQLVARHGAMVYRACLRMLNQFHEAEDAAQAVFIVLARKPPRPNTSLSPWLHGVARHISSKIIRARGRRAYHEAKAASMRTTVREDSATAALREELDAALARLAEPLREAVMLRYLEGRSQEEAARLAGCPQGTLGRRAMEGLERLRTILQRRRAFASAALLGAFLTQEAAAALPALSLLPMKLAAARGITAGPAYALAESFWNGLFWAKVKLLGAVTAIGLLLAGGGIGVAIHRAGMNGTGPAQVASPAPAVLSARVLVQPSAEELITCPADTVAFAPDGLTIASGRCDGSVKMWNAATGVEEATLRGHTARTRSVAFAPDGRLLASASWDGSVRLWDVAAGRERAVLRGPRQFLWAVAFSPDGKTLASASWEGTIRLWDVPAAKERAVLRGHAGRINAIAFAPDGTLVSGGSDGTLRLWDIRSGRPIDSLASGLGEVAGLAISTDGKRLASASLSHDIRLFDLPGRRELYRLAHRGAAAVAFAPNGRVLASTGLDQVTALWDPATGQLLDQVRNCGGWSIAFAPDGQALVVAQSGHVLRVELQSAPRP